MLLGLFQLTIVYSLMIENIFAIKEKPIEQYRKKEKIV